MITTRGDHENISYNIPIVNWLLNKIYFNLSMIWYCTIKNIFVYLGVCFHFIYFILVFFRFISFLWKIQIQYTYAHKCVCVCVYNSLCICSSSLRKTIPNAQSYKVKMSKSQKKMLMSNDRAHVVYSVCTSLVDV